MMLARLISALGPTVENHVICLSAGGGGVADRLRAMGVRVDALELPPNFRALLGLPRLVRLLRELRPHVVHTWLYHADLLGGLAAKSCGIPVIWGLHSATLDAAYLGASTARLIRILARLSRVVPTRIVSCSEAGLRAHRDGGYHSKRLSVIQNGFDTDRFRPDPQLRDEARRAWGFTRDEIVVGHIARFNPLKDHATFFAAAGIAFEREPRLRFVLYGDRVTPHNETLMRWAREAGILGVCSLLGPEPTVERRLPGFDLLVSSSVSEAFPLVLGEAAACGVLSVATDVGDSRAIVGDASRVVPASDPLALAHAIVRTVQLSATERTAFADAGIQRMRDQFALSRVAERFRALYLELAR